MSTFATVVIMVGPPGEPSTRNSLSSLVTIVGVIAKRTLVGADRIGWSLDQSIHVWNTDLCGEVVHFIVEQKAQTSGHYLRAKRAIQCGGDGYSVSFLVHD